MTMRHDRRRVICCGAREDQSRGSAAVRTGGVLWIALVLLRCTTTGTVDAGVDVVGSEHVDVIVDERTAAVDATDSVVTDVVDAVRADAAPDTSWVTGAASCDPGPNDTVQRTTADMIDSQSHCPSSVFTGLGPVFGPSECFRIRPCCVWEPSCRFPADVLFTYPGGVCPSNCPPCFGIHYEDCHCVDGVLTCDGAARCGNPGRCPLDLSMPNNLGLCVDCLPDAG